MYKPGGRGNRWLSIVLHNRQILFEFARIVKVSKEFLTIVCISFVLRAVFGDYTLLHTQTHVLRELSKYRANVKFS